MRVLARGRGGRLLADYHVAAVLGPWSIAADDQSFADGRSTLSAAVAALDPYWSAHAPAFDVELHLGRVRWCWRGVAPDVVDVAATGLELDLTGKPDVETE